MENKKVVIELQNVKREFPVTHFAPCFLLFFFRTAW